MKTSDLKSLSENLIDTFNLAEKSLLISTKRVKDREKEDKSPVSNGDLEVNKLITDKIKELLQTSL